MPDIAPGVGITFNIDRSTDVLRIGTDIVSGRLAFATYAELAAVTPATGAGTPAEVPTTDTGTHTDPVVGGTVNNTGIFRYSASPAGWERIADVDAISARGFADAAEAAEAIVLAVADDFSAAEDTGRATFASGTAVSTNTSYVFTLYPAERSGLITAVRGYWAEAGTDTLFVCTFSGGNATLVDSVSLDVPASGDQTVDLPTPLAIEAGQYFGLFVPSSGGARPHYVAGSPPNYYSRTGMLAGTQAVTVGSVIIQLSATITEHGELAAERSETIARFPFGGRDLTFGDTPTDLGSASASLTRAYNPWPELTFPKGGHWDRLKFWAKAVGRVKALVASIDPATNLLTKVEARELHVTATGAQDFAVDLAIPENGSCWFQFYNGQATCAITTSGRYGDASVSGGSGEIGDGTAVSGSDGPKLEFAAQFVGYRAHSLSPQQRQYGQPRVINDVKWTANLPAGWAINGSGLALNAAGLLSSGAAPENLVGAVYPFFTTLNRMAFEIEFILTATDAKIDVIRRPDWSFDATNSGSLVQFDAPNSRLRLSRYAREASTGALPFADTAIPFTLVAGRKYRLRLENHDDTITSTLTDLIDSDNTVTATATEVADHSSGPGNGQGNFALGHTAGSYTITRSRIVAPNGRPLILFEGDSITKSQGVVASDNYARQLEALMPTGAVAISGISGCKAVAVEKRLEMHLALLQPDWLVVYVGTNDDTLATWQANIAKIAAKAAQYKVNVAFCALAPVRASWVGLIDPDTANAWLRSQGYRVIGLDYAFTTTSSGLKADRDASLILADNVHPNAIGNDKITAQILADLPEPFEFLV